MSGRSLGGVPRGEERRDEMRSKLWRILFSGASLAAMLMAAGAKWKN
jgi:hypothetical protein